MCPKLQGKTKGQQLRAKSFIIFHTFFTLFQGGPGSVRFGYGLGMERFERFRFPVSAVPLRRGFFCDSIQFHREDGSGFGSWKTVPAVPVLRSVPAKTVPTVPVFGSGSGPGPPCFLALFQNFSPSTFHLKTKGFSSRRTKEKKR